MTWSSLRSRFHSTVLLTRFLNGSVITPRATRQPRYSTSLFLSLTATEAPGSQARLLSSNVLELQSKLGAILLNCFDLTSRRDSRALRSNPNSKRGNERSTTFVFANG